MKPQYIKPVLDAAMGDLVTLLQEATAYLQQGEDRSVVGTLIPLDDRVADVKAALHLFRITLQKRRGS